MDVCCVPVKELYIDLMSGYRVLSCSPVGYYEKLELNKWGNFSVSGDNIGKLSLNEQCNISISPITDSKYPASYSFVGYTGIEFNPEKNKVAVDNRYAPEILGRYMTKSQVKNVLDAYPDFIERILNGQQNTIDKSNIKNVGDKRLSEYIEKVCNDCKTILSYPICYKYGITKSKDISTLVNKFEEPNTIKEQIEMRPYGVFVDDLEYSFDKIDDTVVTYFPEMKDSIPRCGYAIEYVLKEIEKMGDTRMDANELARIVKGIAPESFHYIKDIVEGDPTFFYDSETKFVSLHKTYNYEATIANAIFHRIFSPKFTMCSDWNNYRVVDKFKCTDEQMEFLKCVADGNNIVMLSGAAGTGKSSVLKALIHMLEDNMKQYALVAPTGIAAKKMRQNTGRDACTIHLFLLHPGNHHNEFLDYIIIDESSMVSAQLMAELLDAIHENTKIIFICDEAQLPSISAGNVVQDIISSNLIPKVTLTKVFRYGEGGIATLATDVRLGRYQGQEYNYPDLKMIEIDDNPLAQIEEEYKNLLIEGYNYKDITVLSPFNKGEVGTRIINKMIQKIVNGNPPSNAKKKMDSVTIDFRVGDKVLNTKNFYNYPLYEKTDGKTTIPVMNGDIGYIRQIIEENNTINIAIEFDNGIGLATPVEINHLSLGYAVSVHKMQGEQAKAIIVVIDDSHRSLLSRNLLYVAFSRAQEKLIVITNPATIVEGEKIQANMERETWLKDMLKTEGGEADEVCDL